MSIKQTLALGLLATTAILALAPAHAADDAKKDPKTGKKCVIFLASDRTPGGLTRMNYRNICATSFEIRIQAGDKTRTKSIEPGSPDKPSLAYVTCQPDERCEVAKWEYE